MCSEIKLTVPKLTLEEFKKLTKEQAEAYIYLYRTQVAPCLEVFRKPAPYKLAFGGRGSGKSWGFVSLLSQKLTEEPHRLLCCRELQNSLSESSYRLFVDTITRLELKGWNILKDTLENVNGSKIIFRGLKDLRAGNAIKSLEGYDLAFLEEAQSISKESLQLLLPTIRANGSEIWCCFNPNTEEDPINMLKERPGAVCVECNWDSNPWFTEKLRREMEADFKADPDLAEHIWNGKYLKQADNAVMSRTAVREAMNRSIEAEGDYEIAADIARYGSDSTVITMRKGLVMTDLKELKNKSLIETADAIETMAGRRRDMKIKIDETGVGSGVVDIMRARGYKNVIGINFGANAQDKDKYSDLPSEMWCTLPIGEISLISNDRLFHELTDRRYSYDHKARRQVESKDAYKSRNGGKSCDYADSVLMLFYEPKINKPMLY